MRKMNSPNDSKDFSQIKTHFRKGRDKRMIDGAGKSRVLEQREDGGAAAGHAGAGGAGFLQAVDEGFYQGKTRDRDGLQEIGTEPAEVGKVMLIHGLQHLGGIGMRRILIKDQGLKNLLR